MTENKRNIISALLEEYEIHSAADIQEVLKDLLGSTIQDMLESEMNEHLGYNKYEHSNIPNYRNGRKTKKIQSSYGEMEIDVPQDRESTFEPKIVKKRQKDISEIEEKVIGLYTRGMSTRQIKDTIFDIYGFEISEGLVSDITDKMLQKIEEWQNRPLSTVYPIIFIDAVHFSVRDSGIIKKLAAYVILGVNKDGYKEVLSIEIGDNESSKYWLGVLNNLKNRGVQDIMIICADGLTGIKESIATAFPQAEYRRCIVHQVRNTLKYVADKDKKEFAKDLKSIYHAPNEETGFSNMEKVAEKWEQKYPNSMKAQFSSFPLL